MMPGLGGLEVARQLRDRAPATKVIILSMHANDAYVVEALRNGAVGLRAQAGGGARARRRHSRGARRRRATCRRRCRRRSSRAGRRDAKAAPFDPYDTLSTREREVLQLAAEGLTQRRDRRAADDRQAHRRDPSREPAAQARRQDAGRPRALRRQEGPRRRRLSAYIFLLGGSPQSGSGGPVRKCGCATRLPSLSATRRDGARVAHHMGDAYDERLRRIPGATPSTTAGRISSSRRRRRRRRARR